MSIKLNLYEPGFKESRWIVSGGVGIEHLLNVFTVVIDGDSGDVWDACTKFLWHLIWRKERLIMLGSGRRLVPLLVVSISRESYGEQTTPRSCLSAAEGTGDDRQAAQTLRPLPDVNRLLDLPRKGQNWRKKTWRLSNGSAARYSRYGVRSNSLGCSTRRHS